MKHHAPLSFAAIAATALLLSACGPKAETPDANAVAANEVEAPPPSIAKTVAYRCKDGSTFSADFMSDGVGANVRINGAELGKYLTATTPSAAPGGDNTFKIDGYELVTAGSAAELTTPGAPKQSCKS